MAVGRIGFALAGIAGAAALLWLATRVGADDTGGYWARTGLLAAAGLTLALGLLLAAGGAAALVRGGALGVVLVLVAALVAGLWVVAAATPGGGLGADVHNWSGDIGIGSLVGRLSEVAGTIAFGLGALVAWATVTLSARPRRAVVATDEEATVEEPRRDYPAAA